MLVRITLAASLLASPSIAAPVDVRYLPAPPSEAKTVVHGHYEETALDEQLKPRALPPGAHLSQREALTGLEYTVSVGKKPIGLRRAVLAFHVLDGEPVFVDDLYYCGPRATPCGGKRWSYAPGGLRGAGYEHALLGVRAADAPEGIPEQVLLVPGAPPTSLQWGTWRLHPTRMTPWLAPAVSGLQVRVKERPPRSWTYSVSGPQGLVFQREVVGKRPSPEDFDVEQIEDTYFCGAKKPAPCHTVTWRYDAAQLRSLKVDAPDAGVAP